MFGGSEININFPKPISVHLTYQTAFVDDDGKLQLREDVYGRDARMIAILKGSERKVADIAIERPPNTVVQAGAHAGRHVWRQQLRLAAAAAASSTCCSAAAPARRNIYRRARAQRPRILALIRADIQNERRRNLRRRFCVVGPQALTLAHARGHSARER